MQGWFTAGGRGIDGNTEKEKEAEEDTKMRKIKMMTF